MRSRHFTTIAAAGVVALGALAAAQAPARTTWDGVYTEAQAAAGQAVYSDKCSKCHGPSGTGGDAPDLIGSGFASDFDAQPITGLFERTRTGMPQDAPGSLSRNETAAVIAFLLQLNEFPKGQAELPSTAAALDQIMYLAVKPAAPAGAALAMPRSREFEVATIRPSAEQIDRANVGVRISGSQVRVSYLSLKDYIGLAYNVRSGQVAGPDWIGQERFDIAAKFPDDVKKGDFALMLESLLAERFELKVHHESKDEPVYALAIAKGGLKVHEADASDVVPVRPGTTNVEASGSAAGVNMDLGGGASFNLANNKLEIRKMTMASLADSLTRLLDRPVVDRTGVAGIYDMTLEFTPEDYTAVLVRSAINAGVVLSPQALRALDGASANPLALPLETFGLVLDSVKAPMDLVVVDSMQKTPKDN